MRVFIAVGIPDPLKEKIVDVQAALKKSGADVKWVEKENLHLTLKFLGEVPDRDLDRLIDAVGKAVKSRAPFTMHLSGTGSFPGGRNPRVLWIGVQEGADELCRLAASIDAACVPLGFAAETRKFSGHLTVGRLRSPRRGREMAQAAASLKDVQVGSFAVSSVEVMQSKLSPHGSHYTCLRSISI